MLIPKRMRGLARDERGRPIPATVWYDGEGQPQFTINDSTVVARLLREDRCGICGMQLLRVRWFVGGPLSAFHPQGAYFDLPMHRNCMHYALRVCPYLAAPNYAKRIDIRKVRGPSQVFIDPSMIAERPAIFVAVGTDGQRVSIKPNLSRLFPKRPYVGVEYWQHGRQLSVHEGNRFVVEALRAYNEETE
jgi:hypothetical protein